MNEESKKKVCAYIDGANLDKGTSKLGWRIDYAKFYIWLKDKFGIDKAYIFIGFILKYENLYAKMRKAGFVLIFKDVVTDNATGRTKGNCDTDLVLKVARDLYEDIFDNIIIVSSDGDFSSLILFLQEKFRMVHIISPSNKCSVLTIRTRVPIIYLDQVKTRV